MKGIPGHAKKVFKGIIFDTYQWEQELFDGSFATFEKVTRPSIVVTIPVVDDKILVLHEEQPGRAPYFAVPAGFSETTDESPEATAQRELREETGLTSSEWVLFDKYSLYPRMEITDYVFIARNCKRTYQKLLDKGEKQHGEFLYTFDEFIDLYNHDDFASFFFKYHLVRAKFDMAYKKELYKKIFG